VGINDAGEVVVSAHEAGGISLPGIFLSRGTATLLPMDHPEAINDRHQVVGTVSGPTTGAALWPDDAPLMSALGDLGAVSSAATAIKCRGRRRRWYDAFQR
jgi:hypothetical protein